MAVENRINNIRPKQFDGMTIREVSTPEQKAKLNNISKPTKVASD
jgi:hypothetical protein